MATRNRPPFPLRQRGLGELVKQLALEATTLVRQEAQLAKAELLAKAEAIRDDVDGRLRQGKKAFAQDADTLKEELGGKATLIGQAATLLAAAAVVGIFILGLLTALIVRALDEAIPLWASLLSTLVLYSIVSTALMFLGLQRLRRAAPILPRHSLEAIKSDTRTLLDREALEKTRPLLPEQTIETLKEDLEWAKHPTRSATR